MYFCNISQRTSAQTFSYIYRSENFHLPVYDVIMSAHNVFLFLHIIGCDFIKPQKLVNKAFFRETDTEKECLVFDTGNVIKLSGLGVSTRYKVLWLG